MLTLQIAFFLLAASDIYVTRIVLGTKGLGVELNAGIRWLCRRCGLTLGIMLGVMIPTTVILAVTGYFHLASVLAVLVGMRLALLLRQVQVHGIDLKNPVRNHATRR